MCCLCDILFCCAEQEFVLLHKFVLPVRMHSTGHKLLVNLLHKQHASPSGDALSTCMLTLKVLQDLAQVLQSPGWRVHNFSYTRPWAQASASLSSS